jgi:hypothetical protein
LAVVVGGSPGESELPKVVVSVGDHFVWLSKYGSLHQDKNEAKKKGEVLAHAVNFYTQI